MAVDGGAFSTLLRRPGLRVSTGGVLATKRRTQNVIEYTLVLALVLFRVVEIRFAIFACRKYLLFTCLLTTDDLTTIINDTINYLRAKYVNETSCVYVMNVNYSELLEGILFNDAVFVN